MASKDEGQEKTEQPTEKKLGDARDEGKSAKSQELNSLAIFSFGIIMIFIFKEVIGKNFADLSISIFSSLDKLQLNINLLQVYALNGMAFYLKILAPFFIVLILVGMSVGLAQVGIKFTPKALMPKFSTLNPIQGLKNKFFSVQPIIESGKTFLKIALIFAVAWWVLTDIVLDSVNLVRLSIPEIVNYMSDKTITLIWKISLMYLFIAFADFAYQKHKFKSDMKMTKQEVKEEFKQTEGDPQVKGRIKSKQMEMASRRMMADIPKADVVITNPTHFAIALKYDMEKDGAPKVIAKGADRVAQKIKEIARENNVPLHENVVLARALYYNCEIGDEIPEKLFKAVAEVLAYVFKQRKEKKRKSIV